MGTNSGSISLTKSQGVSPAASMTGSTGGSAAINTNNTIVTKKNMLAMKRVLTIAHQLGNNLCESWAIVLDTLDVIHTALVDSSTIVVENDASDAGRIISQCFDFNI